MEQTTIDGIPEKDNVFTPKIRKPIKLSTPKKAVKAPKKKAATKKKVKKMKKKAVSAKPTEVKPLEKSKADLKKAARDLAIKVKATETRGIVDTMLNLFSHNGKADKTSAFELSFLKNVANAEETFKYFTDEYKKAKKEIEKITEI